MAITESIASGRRNPYDTASPLHRWRFRWTSTQLDRKLGSWVKGRLRGVRVVQRGVSPRIVLANVNGTRGTTQVTGPQLRTRLGLYDTWAYFIAINSGQQKDTSGGGSTGGGGSTTGGGGTTTTGGGSAPNSDSSGLAEGGATTSGGAASAAMYTRPNWMRKLLAPRRAQRPRRLVLSGTILPRAKRILVQELRGGHWVTFGRGHTDRRGRYALRLGHRGVYRILANAAIGPAVSVR